MKIYLLNTIPLRWLQPVRYFPAFFTIILTVKIILTVTASIFLVFNSKLSVITARGYKDLSSHSERTFQVFNVSTTPAQRKMPKVAAFVVTCTKNLDSRIRAVNDTWGPDFDKIYYVSDEESAEFQTIKLGEPGYRRIWTKTRSAFLLFYQKHLDEFDWFMKLDDDTYVNVDNLRHFLSSMNPDKPWYFGKHFEVVVKPRGYASGGGGYVISRGTLKLVGPHLMNNISKECPLEHRHEDVAFGQCLSSVNVTPGVTLDKKGRELFHALPLEEEYNGAKGLKWYHNYSVNPLKEGIDCCSERTISFHYVDPNQMRLIYQLQKIIKNPDERQNIGH